MTWEERKTLREKHPGADPLLSVSPEEIFGVFDEVNYWGDFTLADATNVPYSCTCRFLGFDENGAHFDANETCPVKEHVEAFRAHHLRG